VKDLVFVGCTEALLLVVNIVLIRKNERILKEIRRCNHDLQVALSFGRYREAETYARQWVVRMRSHIAGEPYSRRGRPLEDWQRGFAP
jgi:hypothetical protein